MGLLSDCSRIPSSFQGFLNEETRLPVGSAGKEAVARLGFTQVDGKTYLSENYTQIPARVLRALYYDPELPGLPYIIFVNPTGGIVQGDRYEYIIRLGERSEAFITDSMATKIYKMDLNYATRHSEIFLDQNSRLEYLPREVIAFAGSRWHQDITIHVEDGSTMLYSEIFCPGRIASEEFFDFTVFSSKFAIERKGKPVLVDNLQFLKEDKANAHLLLGNRTFLLSAYWYNENAPVQKPKLEFGNIFGGITSMPYQSGFVVKALSDNLDELKEFQLHLWATFRKAETGTGVPSLRIY